MNKPATDTFEGECTSSAPTLSKEAEKLEHIKFVIKTNIYLLKDETHTRLKETISNDIDLLVSAVEQSAIQATKNEWFERGYKQGKLAGMMKERMKHEPDFLDKSLKKVAEALIGNKE